MKRYYVYTWDHERQKFTPHQGVRCGPYKQWSLRRALRALANLGYDTTRHGSPSVLVCESRSCQRLTQSQRIAFPSASAPGSQRS